MSSLFRQEALQNVSRDQDIFALRFPSNVTLSLWTSIFILMFCVLSSYLFLLGVKQKTLGYGMLTYQNTSTLNYGSPRNASVKKIFAHVGDYVEKSTPLVQLHSSSLEVELRSNTDLLSRLKDEKERLNQQLLKHEKHLNTRLADQRSVTLARLQHNEKRAKTLGKLVADQRALHKKGMVSRTTLLATEEKYDEILNRVLTDKALIQDIEHDAASDLQSSHSRLNDINLKIIEQTASLELLVAQHNRLLIRSKAPGYIVDSNIKENMSVHQNTNLFTIAHARDYEAYEALVLVPAVDVKKITLGMEVEIKPSFIEYQKYGAIKGVVKEISPIAPSQSLLTSLFSNDSMLSTVQKSGSGFVVKVALNKKLENPTGVEWTTSSGPKLKLSHGTLVQASITTATKTPWQLIFSRQHTADYP